MGYTIKGSTVGYRTRLLADSMVIENAHIGGRTVFTGCMHVEITGATIGSGNLFHCDGWCKDSPADPPYERRLVIEEGVRIHVNHFFDVAGLIHIGTGTWIAGRGSQFWTHGAGSKDRNIIIGKDCYIGSAVRVSPGTVIGDHCMVALGSVVAGKHTVQRALLGGSPAKVRKKNYDWTRKEKAS